MTLAIRLSSLAFVLLASVAQAQTATTTPDSPTVTAPATPNAITPPNGIARGVIAPDRPIDPKMVTRPRTPVQHNMPVIKPPGTAR